MGLYFTRPEARNKTFRWNIKTLSKIKHKNENLCHKKSQTSYKNWQIIEKSPKLVKKEAKSHKLAKEKSQTWEKSDKVKN